MSEFLRADMTWSGREGKPDMSWADEMEEQLLWKPRRKETMTKEEFDFWADEDPDKLKSRVSEEGLKLAQTWEDEYLVKAGELMLSGWKPEYNRPDTPCMSWYWRRPAKFPRLIGRLFRSTDQAWRALMKET